MDKQKKEASSSSSLEQSEDALKMSNNSSNSRLCYLRWTNIIKSVEVKENNTGLLKSSIGGGSNSSANHNKKKTTTEETQQQGHSNNKNNKIILNKVSGEAKSGEIMALMGPSGSGKTSLLDILSNRSVYQSGNISLNGAIITDDSAKIKSLKRRTAYIKQQDLFFDHLSVRDQLTYTAFLRLPYSKEEKLDEVNKVIDLLRLHKCQDTPIRLVSGGERKRVNIGTELLTDPNVILLDEPTSGLDSTSAVALIKLLTNLAHDHGKTIITSIHQPSSNVFHKFDSVLFLADGCVVYYGTPKSSLDYCDRLLGLPCPVGYNAADHWMDLLVEDSTNIEEGVTSTSYFDEDTEEEKNKLIPSTENSIINLRQQQEDTEKASKSNEIGSNSNGFLKLSMKKMNNSISRTSSSLHLLILQQAQQNRNEYLNKNTLKAKLITNWNVDTFAQEIEEGTIDITGHSGNTDESSNNSSNNDEAIENKFNTSWTTQFQVLLHRALKNSRSAILTGMNLTKSVALGFLIGLLWFQTKNTESTVVDKGSFLFFSNTFWIFDGTFSAIFGFPSERAIIFKERASGSYHLSAYFLSKTLSEMPIRLILPSIYWTIAYWMAGINPRFDIFLGTLGCILLAVLAGESYGLFVSASVMNFEKATTIMIVFNLTAMAAGGYYIKNIPIFLQWLKYVSPFKPGYEVAQTLAFDRDVPCDGSGILREYCTDGVQTASKEEVLEFLVSEGSIGFNIGILVILIIVPRYLAFLALKSKKGDERS
eukprot:CAMPEP_0194151868 /NCGR_PEP_ID=MMETSP0152-20130528/49790_1 /TAXON_ID=1049557 /ORGANISM="Thalassiothrix antarctica, Strain L6-D1" /LENGTH=761 /DNA_ID=CAMNT_0038855963 /DNA_START=149 /DNA_END=2434 /DNA_ORIENTATION=-